MKQGDRRALSRLVTVVEGRNEKAFQVLEQIFPMTGRAYVVGITGPAGAGKSTMIDQLIAFLRSQNKKVGVVAVDPSSPFSGGAVLGDRVRMQRHFNDPDVFIRSVGSRGRSGGLSFSTRAIVQLLDAFGVDVILVETVGAGQSEVDIADLVDTTVVVLVPEAGDSIQAMKAGLLEIAHIFVVNKKDRDGADRVARDLEAYLGLAPTTTSWRPPILQTDAVSGEGVPEVWMAIEEHQKDLKEAGVSKDERLRRRMHELGEIVRERLVSEMMEAMDQDAELSLEIESETRVNLYALSDRVLKKIKR